MGGEHKEVALDSFLLYLIIMNVVTFLAFTVDFSSAWLIPILIT